MNIPIEAIPFFAIACVCFIGAGVLGLYWLKLNKEIKGK
jgi:hypothetical protein